MKLGRHFAGTGLLYKVHNNVTRPWKKGVKFRPKAPSTLVSADTGQLNTFYALECFFGWDLRIKTCFFGERRPSLALELRGQRIVMVSQGNVWFNGLFSDRRCVFHSVVQSKRDFSCVEVSFVLPRSSCVPHLCLWLQEQRR